MIGAAGHRHEKGDFLAGGQWFLGCGMVAADDGNGVFQPRRQRRIPLFQRLDQVGYRRVVVYFNL